jgi:hypothetical protein
MKYARIYAGPDGNTHFEDVEIPMSPDGGDQLKSLLMKATGIIFRITVTGRPAVSVPAISCWPTI